MNVINKCIIIFLLSMAHSHSTAVTPGQSSEKSLPDFGVIFNIDGGITFNSLDPETAAHRIEYHIDTAAGKPLRTLLLRVFDIRSSPVPFKDRRALGGGERHPWTAIPSSTFAYVRERH